MRFTVVTILPELIEPALAAGVVGRAREAGVIRVETVNPRDFTTDRHRTVDDTPYGGGPGMVMKAEPLLAAIDRATHAPKPVDESPELDDETIKPVEARDAETIKRGESLELDGETIKPVAAADLAAETTKPGESPELDGETIKPSESPELDGETIKPVADLAAETIKPVAAADLAAETIKPGEASELDGETVKLGDEAPELDAETIVERRHADETTVERPHADETMRQSAADAELAKLESEVAAEPARPPGDETDVELADLEAKALRAAPLKIVDVETKPIRYGSGDDAQAKIDRAVAAADATAESIERAMSPHTGPTPTTHAHRILLSPSGKPLTQARVRELVAFDHLVLVCGRYEGVDQRAIDAAIDEEISIGDYVLSGGELGALVIIDAVARLVPGVLGEPTSADDESFSAGLLEYPHYTRPQELAGHAVPPVLQSGNHAAIAAWRREQAMRRTAARRPDLWRQFRPSKADAKLFAPLRARTHLALVHHPVFDRTGAVITTALTNFDIHDLARSAMTYGLAGYHVITPITSQREKAEHIAKSWIEDEQGEHRAQALRLVRSAASIEAVIEALTAEHGRAPLVVATSAKAESFAAAARRTSSELLAEASLDPSPLLLLLGTGWGLADALIPSVSRVLAPIEGASEWNHLSVRSAGAVILDRLFGRPA